MSDIPPDEVAEERPRWASVLIYSLLRVLVFVVIWFLIQLVTPLRGLTAVIVALLISGALSFFLLNRQRDAMSSTVMGVFRRINDRIDASTRAEDDD